MKNFQQKRGFKNIIYSRPVLVLFLVLVLIFAWGVAGLFGKMETTGENRKIAENKVAELEKEKEIYLSKINKLDTQEGKEESIREKYPVAKDGEGEIIIVDENKPAQVKKEEPGGFFSFLFFWKNWFK